MLEDEHNFHRGFLHRGTSLRALWSDRQDCSHSVPRKFKCIRLFSELVISGHNQAITSRKSRGLMNSAEVQRKTVECNTMKHARFQRPLPRVTSTDPRNRINLQLTYHKTHIKQALCVKPASISLKVTPWVWELLREILDTFITPLREIKTSLRHSNPHPPPQRKKKKE